MLLIIVSVAVWGVVHSFWASVGAKNLVRRALGDVPSRLYRITYNILAVLSFVPILVWMRSLPDKTLYLVPAPWLYMLLAAQGLAAIGLLVAIVQTDALALIGLRQIAGGTESSRLVTGGFYRYVRHPMYLFGLLVVWPTPVMTVNLLILYIALTIYVFVGAYFEEKKLLAEYGAPYAEYRSHTPMVGPLPFPRSRQAHMDA